MTTITLASERYVPPAASVFTHTFGTNSENPTLTDTVDRGLVFAFGSSPIAASENHRFVSKNKPTSTAYDIIARLRFTPLGYSFFTPGLYLTDGTGKLIFFGAHNGSAAAQMWVVQWWNSQTSFNSNRTGANTFSRQSSAEAWLRIGVVAGVPTDYYVSQNGKDWVKILSEAATGFLTYTQIGFGCDCNRNGGLLPVAGTPHAFISCMYWADADIVPGV